MKKIVDEVQCFWERHTGKGIVAFAVKIVVASWLKILKVYQITKRTGLAYNTSLFSANVDCLPFFLLLYSRFEMHLICGKFHKNTTLNSRIC